MTRTVQVYIHILAVVDAYLVRHQHQDAVADASHVDRSGHTASHNQALLDGTHSKARERMTLRRGYRHVHDAARQVGQAPGRRGHGRRRGQYDVQAGLVGYANRLGCREARLAD